MHDIKNLVEITLRKLVGQPLTCAAQAAAMLTLQFGVLRQYKTPLGRTGESGDWSLHVQCPWRVVNLNGIYTGSTDYWQKSEDDESDVLGETWNPALGNLRAKRMSSWVENGRKSPPKVKSVQSDYLAGFRLNFDDEFALEVFPDSSVDEDWRLLDRVDGEHFVIVAGRLET